MNDMQRHRRARSATSTTIVTWYRFQENSEGMIENIKMVQDFVLVQVDPPEERTASGLVIPDTGKERNNKGYVVAVGPGRRKFPVTVSVGDRVMWKPYDGRTYRASGFR